MNKGAVLVADALLGLDFKVILLGGKARTVSPPTIATLCRAIRQLGHIEMPEGKSIAEAVLAMPDIADRLVAGLACFFEDEEEARGLLAQCTVPKLHSIAQEIVSLVSPDDFFACAALAVNMAKMAAIPRQ